VAVRRDDWVVVCDILASLIVDGEVAYENGE